MNKKILITCVCVVCLLIGVGVLYPRHTPKISVVMSTYNQAKTLPEAIDSIIEQSFDDWELIIVNDGSTDDTADILQNYASKDNRIRVLTNAEHKGFASSFNLGIDKARGEFIARMDDDDRVTPDRLAKQYAFMQEHLDITAVSSFIGNPQTKKQWPIQEKTKSDEMKAELFLGNSPISNSSLFVRRNFLNQHRIRYSDSYESAQNIKFYLDLYDAGAVMGKVPEVLVLHHLRQNSPWQWYEAQWANTDLFLKKEIFPRFNISAKVLDKPSCEHFRQMIETNKVSAILPQAELERGVELKCPRNPVIHTFWKDAFVFDGNRVCRLNSYKECGTIQSRSENEFTMKWDRWGQETFARKDGVWYKKETTHPTPKKETKSGQILKAKPSQSITSVKKKLSSGQNKK